jgi:hypothetical protein
MNSWSSAGRHTSSCTPMTWPTRNELFPLTFCASESVSQCSSSKMLRRVRGARLLTRSASAVLSAILLLALVFPALAVDPNTLNWHALGLSVAQALVASVGRTAAFAEQTFRQPCARAEATQGLPIPREASSVRAQCRFCCVPDVGLFRSVPVFSFNLEERGRHGQSSGRQRRRANRPGQEAVLAGGFESA